MAEDRTRVTVIGIGHRWAGDDAAGVEAVAGLEGLPPEARVVLGGTAGAALGPHFTGSDAVVWVDGVEAGAEPGALFRFSPDDAGVTELRSEDIHGMGLGYLLTNARLSGHFPRVVVLGVQVASVRPEEGLSPPVAAALPRLRELIAEEVAALLAEGAA